MRNWLAYGCLERLVLAVHAHQEAIRHRIRSRRPTPRVRLQLESSWISEGQSVLIMGDIVQIEKPPYDPDRAAGVVVLNELLPGLVSCRLLSGGVRLAFRARHLFEKR